MIASRIDHLAHHTRARLLKRFVTAPPAVEGAKKINGLVAH
jgi:hypothetical protein